MTTYNSLAKNHMKITVETVISKKIIKTSPSPLTVTSEMQKILLQVVIVLT